MSKLITIFGATGAQGSSVARSLLSNTSFAVRGITRNPSSESAQKLSTSGTEVVKADGWDKGSVVAAFKGSWGVFVNTNSEDPIFFNPEEKRTEVELGKSIVDAAVEAGVEVFVYSGMASATEATKGKIPVTAFDAKHEIGEYAKSTGAFKSVGIVSAGWYYENFLIAEMCPIFGGFPHVPTDDGSFVFRVPRWGGKEDVNFISISDDFGDIVHGVFLEPERYNGVLVQGVSDIASFDGVTAAFEKVTDKKARWEEIPNWRDLDVSVFPPLEGVKLMFGFVQEAGGRYYGVETEKSTAAELKKRAAEASGKSGEEAILQTVESFWAKHFGKN
ncbi:NAD(P)-binding protein [Amniculicola lignicola CBS 123094]|uniref:NAD(P)-binding protein n=1 Tax=Amniculicola lignicola CBS 123094 TaxID=1392246 RepID=A0A6A5W164_9PLEO|nr:NAD(P)-binding protein [Amniculicola lignicola CBS 123094]